MANFNLNKVILGGRLTNDPEMRVTSNGISMASFSIAVNRRFQSRDAQGQSQQPTADFFNCTAWRQTAELVSRYFRKGSSICIIGSIQNRTVTDQQGQKRTYTDIVVEEVQFVDSKNEGPQIQPAANPGYQQAPQYQPNGGYDRQPQFSTPSQNDGGYGSAQPQQQFEQSPNNNQAGSFEELKFDDDLPF